MRCSVVIATYNGENYIEEQLNSILNQTLKPNEIVICDDLSTDNTLKILHQVKKRTTVPIKVFQHKKNMGVRSSFSDAIRVASEEIIFLCDQDDYWYENKIECFMNVFANDNDIIMVFSDADVVDQNLKKTGKTLWNSINFTPTNIQDSTNFADEILKRNIFTGMCMAVKKELIKSNKMFIYNEMLHDEEIGWNAIFTGKIEMISKPLVAYRQHSENVIGSSNTRKFESFAFMRKKVKESTERTQRKFKELSENPLSKSNPTLYEKLNNAFLFYTERLQLYTESRIKGGALFLKMFMRGDYSRYCSKSENAIKKDITCILIKAGDLHERIQ